uniref:Uncharacterized protein n=1 Tax=Calcidiscus leptoporus TaxID=127549 RepID=A0A7S0JI44_9EUKA
MAYAASNASRPSPSMCGQSPERHAIQDVPLHHLALAMRKVIEHRPEVARLLQADPPSTTSPSFSAQTSMLSLPPQASVAPVVLSTPGHAVCGTQASAVASPQRAFNSMPAASASLFAPAASPSLFAPGAPPPLPSQLPPLPPPPPPGPVAHAPPSPFASLPKMLPQPPPPQPPQPPPPPAAICARAPPPSEGARPPSFKSWSPRTEAYALPTHLPLVHKPLANLPQSSAPSAAPPHATTWCSTTRLTRSPSEAESDLAGLPADFGSSVANCLFDEEERLSPVSIWQDLEVERSAGAAPSLDGVAPFDPLHEPGLPEGFPSSFLNSVFFDMYASGEQ